jgi:hypothetical protein
MVMREASNGGASGRVCADTAAKFPASTISAANALAALHQDFQDIAILQSIRSIEWEFRQGIYLHPCAHVSNQKCTLKPSAEEGDIPWFEQRVISNLKFEISDFNSHPQSYALSFLAFCLHASGIKPLTSNF